MTTPVWSWHTRTSPACDCHQLWVSQLVTPGQRWVRCHHYALFLTIGSQLCSCQERAQLNLVHWQEKLMNSNRHPMYSEYATRSTSAHPSASADTLHARTYQQEGCAVSLSSALLSDVCWSWTHRWTCVHAQVEGHEWSPGYIIHHTYIPYLSE